MPLVTNVSQIYSVCSWLICVGVNVVVFAPSFILRRVLDDMESKHAWYYIRHESRNNLNLIYLSIVWFQLFFKHSLWGRWLCTVGVLVYGLLTVPQVASLGLFSLIVNFTTTKLLIVNKLELANVLKVTRTKLFGDRIIQDLLPYHILTSAGESSRDDLRTSSVTCGIMFVDIVGFSALTDEVQSRDAFLLLSYLFDFFDELCDKWGITKIDTIGHCYWCAVGLQDGVTQNDMVRLLGIAIEMQDQVKRLPLPPKFTGGLGLKVGIHYGPCLGGIVGFKMPRYHLFGSHVQVARLLQQSGTESGILLSGAACRFAGANQLGIVVLHDLFPAKKIGKRQKGRNGSSREAFDGHEIWKNMYEGGMRLTSHISQLPDSRMQEIDKLLTGHNPLGPRDLSDSSEPSCAKEGCEVFPTYLIKSIVLRNSEENIRLQ